MRALLGKSSEFAISKHKYYELKHFCLQYPEWKSELAEIQSFLVHNDYDSRIKANDISDPCYEAYVRGEKLRNRMKMVEHYCTAIDPLVGPFIFKGVTEDTTYDKMNALDRVPCCREKYYYLYRKFFWIMAQQR